MVAQKIKESETLQKVTTGTRNVIQDIKNSEFVDKIHSKFSDNKNEATQTS